MKLKEIINQSWYGSIGYIDSYSSLEIFLSYLTYNKPVLDEYKEILFAFTYDNLSKNIIEENVKNLYPNANFIFLDKNRGHNFGTADLDNCIIKYCKKNNIEWLCKTSNDVILDKEILNIEINNSDFYYLNGFSYETLLLNNFDFKKLKNYHFYPQTNFYIINISKIDYLIDENYINVTYEEVKNIKNYNGKVWEYFKGWSCENFLKESVTRNSLKPFHLLNNSNYKKLFDLVKMYKIGDPSHKNIMINGICHYHNPNTSILQI